MNVVILLVSLVLALLVLIPLLERYQQRLGLDKMQKVYQICAATVDDHPHHQAHLYASGATVRLVRLTRFLFGA